jgi:DnaJ-class molecular chaperone
MTDTSSQPLKKPNPCIGCGGSGQTSFFGGASRFMFTWEDCPDCHGTGVTLDEFKEETNTSLPSEISQEEE